MSRLAAGVLIGVAVVAVSVFVASRADVSQARGADETFSAVEGDEPLGGTAAGDEDGVEPFVGIVISTLSPEEAAERGLQSGVLVDRVQDGGPADGALLVGDVIVAIGPEATAGTGDVIRIVQASTPGDTLTFTVSRGTQTLDVAVEVGARYVRTLRITERLRGLAPGFSGPGLPPDAFVKAEIVVEVDGVFKTLKVVKGTVESVDVEAGTFVLAPGDGSEAISFTISEDTIVNLRGKGDLGGLTAGEEALVADVDGDVKLVNQGGGLLAPLLHGGLIGGLMPGLSGKGPAHHRLLPRLDARSGLTDRFRFRTGHIDLEEILDRLRELRLRQ